MRKVALSFVLTIAACGGSPSEPQQPTNNPPPPPPSGSATADPPPKTADPFELPGNLKSEPLPASVPVPALTQKDLPALAKDAPKPPKECDAFAKRKAAKAPACADRAAALAALDAALGEKDAAKRDAALAGLESCTGLPPGVARGVRAEHAPAACGDALVEPILKKPPSGLEPLVQDALVGLGIAARLARTARGVPELKPPFEKAKVLAYQKGPGAQWALKETQAIRALGEVANKLSFYGKAVAELEGGVAELRIVEALREAPIPDEFKKIQEAADVYYANLDAALDDWKTRGRNGTLLGMASLSHVGEVRSERLDRARKLLAKLYGGRRIDALDKLVLPALVMEKSGLEARVASRVGTFWAGLLLPADAWKKDDVLTAMAWHGIPAQHRIAMRGGELTKDQKLLAARARIELFRVYWRAFDADEAVTLAHAAGEGEDARFLLAIGLGLRGGPGDAAQMMVKAPLASLGIGSTRALEAVAEKFAGKAGDALFDAAYLRDISPPDDAKAAHYKDVAKKYREAEGKLASAAQKKEAAERASAAEAIAKELETRK